MSTAAGWFCSASEVMDWEIYSRAADLFNNRKEILGLVRPYFGGWLELYKKSVEVGNSCDV